MDDLPEDLEYNPFTGVFKRGKYQIRGSNGRGYRRFCFKGRHYLVHRVVWLMFYGFFPRGDIDHVNGNKTDNRIANLREVSHQVNLQNMRTISSAKKSSGLLGVSWDSHKHKRRKRWRAYIRANGKMLELGRYHTAEEAHRVYLEAKRKYHPESSISASRSMEPTGLLQSSFDWHRLPQLENPKL